MYHFSWSLEDDWLIKYVLILYHSDHRYSEEEKLLWSLWMNETKDRHTFVHDVSFYWLIYVGVIIAGGLGIHSHLSWLIFREIPFWLGTFLQETSKNPFVDYRYLVLWCSPLLPREPFCEINFSFPFTIFQYRARSSGLKINIIKKDYLFINK